MTWKCNICGTEFERLKISWETSGGQKVGIEDCFCQFCPSDSLTFLGSEKERDEYWKKEWD